MARADVIILNYNGLRFLGPCLTALRAQTYHDFRITLVDNGSSDGSVELVRAEFPEVCIIALAKNLGFCVGNNRGIEATSGEYVALLNNDTEVAPTWLQVLITTLDHYPKVGFCASKMIRLSDRATVDTAGDVFYVCGVGGKRGEGEPAEHYTEPEQVFGACAGAALYRRSMLDKIGLLDADLFAMDEDIDLSFRAQLQGYQCQYVPEAIVYHHVSGSFGMGSGKSIGLTRRNMLEVLIKNMPVSLLLKYAPLILGYYIGGDIYYSLRGYAKHILWARWENLKRFPHSLAKRRIIQHNRTISTRELDALLITGCRARIFITLRR
jgi:GT2 family glycosyltransferase